jgi:hypothetical protein
VKRSNNSHIIVVVVVVVRVGNWRKWFCRPIVIVYAFRTSLVSYKKQVHGEQASWSLMIDTGHQGPMHSHSGLGGFSPIIIS